jgi:GxxExxY protein
MKGFEKLTEEIIGAAIEVHRTLGPGLLESVYEECMALELRMREIQFERQRRFRFNTKDNVLADLK